MRRRDFLKRTTAAAAGTVAAAYVPRARAQARKDTLLTLSESGPNNLDVMGVGTNRPRKSGPLPKIQRVIWHIVLSAATFVTLASIQLALRRLAWA